MTDEQKKTEEELASELLEKQAENRQITNNNMAGKGGFQDHPENINRNGRPPKEWSWSDLLAEVGEEVMEQDPDKRTFRQIVGKRLWLESAKGNVNAIKELMNRMDGLPKVKIDHSGKIDSGSQEVAKLLQEMYAELHKDGTESTNNS